MTGLYNGCFTHGVDSSARVMLPSVWRPTDPDTQFAVIRSGLAAGETVVTEGQFQLKPGALVETREPGESREPGGNKAQGKGKATGPAGEAKKP